MEDDSSLGVVFTSILVGFVLSGLTLVVVGGVMCRREEQPFPWLLIMLGIVILAVPATALTFPALLS